MKNYAFIDGQNLYMGIQSNDPKWNLDFFRFRIYLREKYKVEKAYYYMGYMLVENNSLYERLQEAGFIVKFRKHNAAMESHKKVNVDSDIIFDIMKRLYKKEPFDNIILISGDGDYRLLVDFLIEEKRFEKILFPNHKYASSLYKKLSNHYFANLSSNTIRKKISIKKKRVP